LAWINAGFLYLSGQTSVEEHREKGGDPDVDVSYQYLTFFLDDDAEVSGACPTGSPAASE
jgi:tryptophanyl-tRNA synthetase